MLDPSTKKDIEKISYDLLKQSKALDIYPTPIDKLVNFSDLEVSRDINLASVDNSFLSKASVQFQDAINKVKGILDRKKKIIYLDLSLPPSSQGFIQLHETGHDMLYWQNEIIEFLDDEETLSPFVQEQFEAEANYFASITLFQQDRFNRASKRYPLDITSILKLAKEFGASIHATLRRYVETSEQRCTLVVLKNISKYGISPNCELRDTFSSQKFLKNFGTINWPEKFGYKWPFVKDYYFGKKLVQFGKIELETEQGITEFNYQFFNNTYNGFVLIFPNGEKNNSRVKFIIN